MTLVPPDDLRYPEQWNAMQRSCSVKRGHPKKSAAQFRAGQINRNIPNKKDRVKAYWCSFCLQWHVGGRKSKRNAGEGYDEVAPPPDDTPPTPPGDRLGKLKRYLRGQHDQPEPT